MSTFGKDPKLRMDSGLDQGPGRGTKEELTELSRWERMRVILEGQRWWLPRYLQVKPRGLGDRWRRVGYGEEGRRGQEVSSLSTWAKERRLVTGESQVAFETGRVPGLLRHRGH